MKPKDECGIAAVYSLKKGLPDTETDLGSYIPLMLQDMQNRGELSAGMTSYAPDRPYLLKTWKALGQVKEAFKPSANYRQQMEEAMQGCAAIGHVRYATCGKDDVSYAQPFEREHGRLHKWFSFCFNGNIANHVDLNNYLVENKGYHISLESDTEIIMHYLARQIAEFEDGEDVDYVQIFRNLAATFDGAWCLAMIDAQGDLVVARDPLGFKPCSYAVTDDKVLVASESVAIWNRGVGDIQTLEPGHLLRVNKDGVKIEQFAESKKKAHCFFEWVYFSNVASDIDGVNVYESRVRAGEILAKKETLEIDEDTIVVSVPDTAKASGDAMGFALGAKVVEGLFRNRYVGRSFIKSGADRATVVQQKFTPMPAVLKGKKVLLVEDSLVRGTTLTHIIKDMKLRGEVAEVHLRIACPPILSPCFYGIDMSTLGELFARQYIGVTDTESDLSEEVRTKMANFLGADSLTYITHKDLAEVTAMPYEDLCMACVTSDYPTDHGKQLIARARENALAGKAGRSYDK